MNQIDDFKLRQAIATCPACRAQFETPYLVNAPAITASVPVATDLHRVLPDAAIRAALMALCLECGYADWISRFSIEPIDAESFAVCDPREYPRRFANAFISARAAGTCPADLALIALNGAWCSQEAGLAWERWNDLAAQELEKALFDRSWTGDRGYYHYLMGEISRQLSDFRAAVRHFDRAARSSRLPAQLIVRQKVQATAADASLTLLPPYVVETLFCPGRTSRTSAA